MTDNVITEEVRFNFPNVFRPGKPLNPTDEPKYSLMMLFKPGADLSKLKAAAKEAMVDKWGADKDKWPKNLRTPFRDQSEKSGTDGFEDGAIFISARSSQRPGVVDNDLNDIIDDSEVYSGCWGKVSLRAFAYDTAGNRGVSFGLQNVMKTRDGDPLGGSRAKPQDEFTPVSQNGASPSDFDNSDLFG